MALAADMLLSSIRTHLRSPELLDPLSAISLVASVLQLADLGAKLSVKLFNISKQVKNASAHYESISQEVASTNAVVQQLSPLLLDDRNRQLFGPAAIQTIGSSIAACEELFRSLLDDITPKIEAGSSSTAKKLAEWKRRLTLPYKQAELTIKQSKLQQLKGTLAFNLNIIVLAVQVRLHDSSIDGKLLLLEQREAVRFLHHAIVYRKEDATEDAISELLPPRTTSFHVHFSEKPEQIPSEDSGSEKSKLIANAEEKSNAVVDRGFSISDTFNRVREPHTKEQIRSHLSKPGAKSILQEPEFPSTSVSCEVRNRSLATPKELGPTERDRARFKAHAILIQDILALIERNRASVRREIETDMYNGTLALHHKYWICRKGSPYCFAHLLPHISECEEVQGEFARHHALRSGRQADLMSKERSLPHDYTPRIARLPEDALRRSAPRRSGQRDDNMRLRPNQMPASSVLEEVGGADAVKGVKVEEAGDVPGRYISASSVLEAAAEEVSEASTMDQQSFGLSAPEDEGILDVVDLLGQWTTLTGDDLSFFKSMASNI